MSERKLTASGMVWRYRVGRHYTMSSLSPMQRSPSGQRYNVSFAAITGRSSDVIERGRRKRTSDGMVRPSDVARWIRGVA